MRAHLIMDHGVSACFGTISAPNVSYVSRYWVLSIPAKVMALIV